MAAAGIGNPSGAQQIDSWPPRVWTFTARSNISGGALVFASGANNAVGVIPNLYSVGSVLVTTDASGGNFTGVALMSAASGTAVAIATDGVFLLQANGTIIAGNGVNCDGNNAVLPAGSETINAFTTSKLIGRAFTAAASGGFCAVYVRG